MKDFKEAENLKRLLEARDELKEAKMLEDKIDELAQKSTRTSSVSGEGFKLEGKPKTTESVRPDFVLKDEPNLPVKSSGNLPDVAGEVIDRTENKLPIKKVGGKLMKALEVTDPGSVAEKVLGALGVAAKPATGLVEALRSESLGPEQGTPAYDVEHPSGNRFYTDDQLAKASEFNLEDLVNFDKQPPKRAIASTGTPADPNAIVNSPYTETKEEKQTRKVASSTPKKPASETPTELSQLEKLQAELEKLKGTKEDAKTKDMWLTLAKGLLDASAHYSAANPYSDKNQVIKTDMPTDLGSKEYKENMSELMEKLKLAQASAKENALSKYRQDTLDVQRDAQKLAMQRREEAKEAKQSREDRLAGQFKEAQKDKYDDKIFKATEAFEKHPTVKKLAEQGLSFGQASNLIGQMKSGNEVALGALGTKMARAMGEVGVLTNTDVKRYIEAQSIANKMKDMYGRNFYGKLSDKTVKDLEEVIGKMKKGFKAQQDSLYTRYVNKTYENYGKQAGLSKDDVAARFGFDPREEGSSTQEEKVLMESPDGQKVMVRKDKVQKYLDKGAKVIK